MTSIEFTHSELNALYSSLIIIEDQYKDDALLLAALKDARYKIQIALRDEWLKKGVK